jgi:hypothetical protein
MWLYHTGYACLLLGHAGGLRAMGGAFNPCPVTPKLTPQYVYRHSMWPPCISNVFQTKIHQTVTTLMYFKKNLPNSVTDVFQKKSTKPWHWCISEKIHQRVALMYYRINPPIPTNSVFIRVIPLQISPFPAIFWEVLIELYCLLIFGSFPPFSEKFWVILSGRFFGVSHHFLRF